MKSKLEHYMEISQNDLRNTIKNRKKRDLEKFAKKKPRKIDYSELSFKLDKFMPDDPDAQNEFYRIIDEADVDEMENFLMDAAEEETMFYYMPKGGTVRGFAEYLIKHGA